MGCASSSPAAQVLVKPAEGTDGFGKATAKRLASILEFDGLESALEEALPVLNKCVQMRTGRNIYKVLDLSTLTTFTAHGGRGASSLPDDVSAELKRLSPSSAAAIKKLLLEQAHMNGGWFPTKGQGTGFLYKVMRTNYHKISFSIVQLEVIL